MRRTVRPLALGCVALTAAASVLFPAGGGAGPAWSSVNSKVVTGSAGTSPASATATFGSVAPAVRSAQPLPAITAIVPRSGSMVEPTTVVVTGTDLDGITAVTASGVPVKFTKSAPTTLSVTMPAHAAGPVTLVASGPAGASPAGTASTFTYFAPPAPAVSNLDPNTVTTKAATQVTVTGSFFVGTVTATVDGKDTAVTRVSDTQLRLTVPVHAAGVVPVVVTAAGGSAVQTSLTYLAPPRPAITALAPASGWTAETTTVVAIGANFDGITAVTANGVPVTFTKTSPSTLVVTMPARAAGPVTLVAVSLAGASRAGTGSTFTYVALPPPAVSDLSPKFVTTMATTPVTVTGTSFIGTVTATVGGRDAVVTRVSETQLLLTAPVHAAGWVPVVVTTAGGSDVLSLKYVVPPLPAITAIAPASGSTTETTTVVATGANFDAIKSVTANGVSVKFTRTSPTTLSVTMPAHAAGPVTLVAVSLAGASVAGNASRFTYVTPPVPTVHNLDPKSVTTLATTAVTVTGTSFIGTTTATVDGKNAVVTRVSETQLLLTVPVHAAGVVQVVVKAAGGSTVQTALTYVAPPVPKVTALSPTSVTTKATTSVTVTGTSFIGTITATVDGKNAVVTQISETELRLTAPAHAAGVVQVVVKAAGGSATQVTLTYVAPAPVVRTISPSTGAVSTGTVVSISGTGFTGTIAVKIGGTRAAYKVVSDTVLKVTVPRKTAGKYPVTVTTAAGTSRTGTYTVR